ncbi:MAG: restriction endonuclease, partial [Clostridiales bacterium]|nr:restriction endonuclease [Clostridiales bacterium]
MTFNDILAKYRVIAFSERDKGTRFERLMRAYLMTDPKYTPTFKSVWLWEDFFAREELGGTDTGIDLVAETFDGGFWAIQCKCYNENTAIDKPDVDTFLSTSGRKFRSLDGQQSAFSFRLWISTTAHWTANAENTLLGQSVPITRINISDLQNAPVDWDRLER